MGLALKLAGLDGEGEVIVQCVQTLSLTCCVSLCQLLGHPESQFPHPYSGLFTCETAALLPSRDTTHLVMSVNGAPGICAHSLQGLFTCQHVGEAVSLWVLAITTP